MPHIQAARTIRTRSGSASDGGPGGCLEAKTEEDPTGEIGARTAQQAAGHEAWARARRPLRDDAHVLCVLVSDRTRLGEGAEVHAGDVRVASLNELRALADEANASLMRARTLGQAGDDVALRLKASRGTRRGAASANEIDGPARTAPSQRVANTLRLRWARRYRAWWYAATQVDVVGGARACTGGERQRRRPKFGARLLIADHTCRRYRHAMRVRFARVAP